LRGWVSGLELEEIEHVVQSDDLGILLSLFRGKEASTALLGQFGHPRREIFTNRVERRLKLLQRPLLHDHSLTIAKRQHGTRPVSQQDEPAGASSAR